MVALLDVARALLLLADPTEEDSAFTLSGSSRGTSQHCGRRLAMVVESRGGGPIRILFLMSDEPESSSAAEPI